MKSLGTKTLIGGVLVLLAGIFMPHEWTRASDMDGAPDRNWIVMWLGVGLILAGVGMLWMAASKMKEEQDAPKASPINPALILVVRDLMICCVIGAILATVIWGANRIWPSKSEVAPTVQTSKATGAIQPDLIQPDAVQPRVNTPRNAGRSTTPAATTIPPAPWEVNTASNAGRSTTPAATTIPPAPWEVNTASNAGRSTTPAGFIPDEEPVFHDTPEPVFHDAPSQLGQAPDPADDFAPPQFTEYVVCAGDSLASISQRFFGNPEYANMIISDNQLHPTPTNPKGNFYIGQKLKIRAIQPDK